MRRPRPLGPQGAVEPLKNKGILRVVVGEQCGILVHSAAVSDIENAHNHSTSLYTIILSVACTVSRRHYL